MEMLSMGPGRRADDTLLQVADNTEAEPVDLGARSRSTGREAKSLDLDERGSDTDAPWEEPSALGADHWLAGLVRAEVLGVSGAAVLLLVAVGLPFLSAFEMINLYIGPYAVNPAWSFVPALVSGVLAASLGLGGLRQAAYRGAATWARITSGASAVVGLLVTVGVALAWFAMAQADPFEQPDPFEQLRR